MATLVATCTIYELYKIIIASDDDDSDDEGDDDSKRNHFYSIFFNRIAYIFSAVSNTKRLYRIDGNPHHDGCTQSSTDSVRTPMSRVAVFDLFRLVLVALIGLTSLFYNTATSGGLMKMSQSAPYEMLYSAKYFFIRIPTFLNDGLLVISSALFLRTIFVHLHRPNGPSHDMFSHLVFLIKRWIRLTLPLFGSIMFIYVLPLVGDGPLWTQVGEQLMPPCTNSSSLASTLLYYSNWNMVKSNYSNSANFLVVSTSMTRAWSCIDLFHSVHSATPRRGSCLLGFN